MGGINDFSLDPADQNRIVTVGQERKITFWDLRKSNAENIAETSPY
jgi:hypothetical protein